MNNLICDDICRTLSMGDGLLDVRTADEFNNGCLTDVENMGRMHHYQHRH